MEIQQFRYFLTAARYENLTKAADELHIAQPALSQSVKRLETELGVSLFDRKNHRIELNEQGKLLKKRLIPLMESIDNLKDELWESVYSSEHDLLKFSVRIESDHELHHFLPCPETGRPVPGVPARDDGKL